MSAQLRALRNRCLRAVAESNDSVLRDAFRKMTPAELRALRADADVLSGRIGDHLANLPDVMKVSDRDE